MLLERYYEGNAVEMEIRDEIEMLLKDYSFKNKKKLREKVKITWIENA